MEARHWILQHSKVTANTGGNTSHCACPGEDIGSGKTWEDFRFTLQADSYTYIALSNKAKQNKIKKNSQKQKRKANEQTKV